MIKHIVLCADDYAYSPEVSAGIVELIQANRITATSCLVTTPYWQQYAKYLLPFTNKIDIGLHLNLTEGLAISKAFIKHYGERFFSLKTLMCKSIFRLIDQSVIEEEFHSQISKFTTVTGYLPDYLDGHQHIHQFPIVRQALINCYYDYASEKKIYLRSVNNPLNVKSDVACNFKKQIINFMGGRAFKKDLERCKIPHNTSFSGIYPFNSQYRYERIFPLFLDEIKHGGIILCHPSAKPKYMQKLATLRFAEYQFLLSDAFEKCCRNHGIELVRFFT